MTARITAQELGKAIKRYRGEPAYRPGSLARTHRRLKKINKPHTGKPKNREEKVTT